MKVSDDKFEKLKKSVKTFGQKAKEAGAYYMDWASANKKIVIPFCAAVVLVVLVFIAVMGGRKNGAMAASGEDKAGADQTVESVIPVPEVPLKENEYPEVNKFITEYFNALAEGNIDAVMAVRSYTSDEERIRVEKKAEYIESYPTVDCYTKAGPMEDSWLVYVYYTAKFYNYDTTAAGISSYLVCRKDDGSLWILDGPLDDNVTNYLKAISAQEDVKELFNRAEVKFAEARDADAKLSVFMDEMSAKLDEDVAEALAALEVPQTDETAADTGTDVQEPAETETASEPAEENSGGPQLVEATDVVNIRSSDSETADKVGKAQIGEQFTLLENRGNGWSKISYNGAEAFMKTEFLKPVDTGSDDSAAAESTPEQNNEAPADESEKEPVPEGKVRVKESVSVRKSASESGEKIGVAYQGELLDLIMKQADGWTKVKYNGETAYVKSEFVE